MDRIGFIPAAAGVLRVLAAFRPVALDLGGVDMIADVRVNGEKAGVLWAAPYRLDIGKWVKPGGRPGPLPVPMPAAPCMSPVFWGP